MVLQVCYIMFFFNRNWEVCNYILLICMVGSSRDSSAYNYIMYDEIHDSICWAISNNSVNLSGAPLKDLSCYR